MPFQNINAVSKSNIAPIQDAFGEAAPGRQISSGRWPNPGAQRAGEPENDKNDKHEAEDAAQPRRAIATVRIVAAPAAQKNNDKNDQQNRHHDEFPFYLN
jgi:hypothetical protein